MEIQCWQMVGSDRAMERAVRVFDPSSLEGDRVLVEVAGCGVCHTDLGFFYDGVKTRHPLPLTLGHEISGRVVEAGSEAQHLLGRATVVPAVVPCGECAACQSGRGAICGRQFFPGNDDHGGFASHVVVPGRGLSPLDESRLESVGLDLSTLSVVADAVTTPYQAIVNAGLESGDVAIFVGVGGVGAFGLQIAAALGAHAIAIDVDPDRLQRVAEVGPELTICSREDPAGVKREVRAWVRDQGYSPTGWKIFETSGHPDGQRLAYSLLGYDAHLAVVGYTREKIELRLSNLMAFDATARGTWGCLPEHYGAVLDLVLSGQVQVKRFVQEYPMSRVNEVFEELRSHRLKVRPILIPDFT